MQSVGNRIIGRKSAIQELERAYASKQSALVSVIGRRRIGKTFLISEVYSDRLAFTVTGIQGANKTRQLNNFSFELKAAFQLSGPPEIFTDWLTAFVKLSELLDQRFRANDRKPVIFIDELPWMSSRRSGFLQAFGWFWNSWAVKRDVVIVICGSAASWMIKKVVHAKGSLHNRITNRIHLKPFSLGETALFLSYRNVLKDSYQQLLAYMAVGGVPYYLEQFRENESAVQGIQRLFFDEGAPLVSEFKLLYTSLFAEAELHIAVIKALFQKHSGLLRSEISTKSNVKSGGQLTRILEELEVSGFIQREAPFGKRKQLSLYRLVDEYSLFYLQFVDGKNVVGPNAFSHLFQSSTFKSWSGFSFEAVCWRHVAQIKKALGISGMYVQVGSYVSKTTLNENGVQIDLVLDRSDQAITLLEMKFSTELFTVSKSYAANLKEKVRLFRLHSKTKKQIFLVLVTTHGMKSNDHSIGLIDGVITSKDLMD